jgi:DNA-binding MarR family transcriptional regulator
MLRLWLRVLTLHNMVEQRVRRKLREEYGVTLPRFDVMAVLYNAPDGMSMSDVSRWLMVSNGNVTGIVERLEREGLVHREPRPEDRRRHHVRLTDEGRAAFEAMAAGHEAWISDMFSGLSAEEVRQLYELLGRAKRSVRESVGEEDA